MNRLFLQAPALLLVTFGTVALAQVDIYQSDAYSAEEMCAREAEQHDSSDYSRAYEQCLSKNRDKSRHQPEQEVASTEEEQTEPAHSRDDGDPEKDPARRH